MAKKKTKQFKATLGKYLNSNKRAPVWVVLKTGRRDVLRKRKRRWRHDKLKLHTKHRVQEEKRMKHKFVRKK